MNIAEITKEYYEHDDFIDNYAFILLEDGDNCIYNIKKELPKWFYFNDYNSDSLLKIDTEDAERIFDYMRDNYDDFVDTFCGYYVGDYCIDSISFGEQEEQLTGLYNHKTGKNYDIRYLRKIFEQEDYVVNGDYAYYNLSADGVGIWLKPDELPFFEELKDKYTTNK